MAGRQRATFKKRQREVKRLEKQRLKAEKRAARRLEHAQAHAPQDSETQLPIPVPDHESTAEFVARVDPAAE